MLLTSDFKKTLPSQPGVYLFLNKNTPIYIGRATNLKSRIISHFQSAKINPKESLIISQSDNIKVIPTNSDIDAVLLEAELIKQHQPKYNFRWKDDKNFLYIKITNEEFPKVQVVRKENDKKSLYFGPFSNQLLVNDFLREIRRIIPFCSQKKIGKIPCFYSKINLCQPCPNFINSIKDKDKNLYQILKKEYRSNIKKIIALLNRNFNKILSFLHKKLNKAINEENYEEGIKIRNKIFILNQLINKKITEAEEILAKDKLLNEIKDFFQTYFGLENYSLNRIECYDISNFFGQQATGSMVVLQNYLPDKSHYRRFKIKTINNISDTEMLKEVIFRRFKNKNWPKPDLIVIDGGKPQLLATTEALKKIGLIIPVLGLAKSPDRVVIFNKEIKTVSLPQNSFFFNLLRRIRDESHRFAKKYHLLLRKNFLYN